MKVRLFKYYIQNLRDAYISKGVREMPLSMANQLIAPKQLETQEVVNAVFSAFEEYDNVVGWDSQLNQFDFNYDTPVELLSIHIANKNIFFSRVSECKNTKELRQYFAIITKGVYQSLFYNLGDKILWNSEPNAFKKINCLLYCEFVRVNRIISPVLPKDYISTKIFEI